MELSLFRKHETARKAPAGHCVSRMDLRKPEPVGTSQFLFQVIGAVFDFYQITVETCKIAVYTFAADDPLDLVDRLHVTLYREPCMFLAMPRVNAVNAVIDSVC